jgi:signal transduction histidine kinase/CheY-like chemotaxis protein
MFLTLTCFAAVTAAVEVSNLKAVRERVTGISGASLPELVDTQKVLLGVENLRRFAEVAYVSRTPKSRREARLSAREIVAETVFLSSEGLHEDALRVSRIIDSIVRNRTGIEKEQEDIRTSSVIYLQALENMAPYLRTPQERQAVFGLFLDFFISPREDFSARPPEEVAQAFQRHIREVQITADRISPSLSPSGQGVLAAAVGNVDHSLHGIAESFRAMEAANAELKERWEEIDTLLQSMRDRTRIGGETAVESALGAIGDVSSRALADAYALSGALALLIALDFAFLHLFVNRPLRWTSRKLMEIQEGVLDSPAPVIRVREVAVIARHLDRFAGRLGELYRQSNELEEAAAAKNDLEEVMRAVFMASLDGYVVWDGGAVELVSPMTLKLLGVDGRGEFAGRPELYGFSAARLSEILKTAAFEKSVREDATLSAKGGREVPVELTHLPIRFRGRDCLLTYIRDLRRQKRSEEALKDAKVQAEVAATAKSEFLANMSHEIMTPLNGILGLTRMALADGQDGPQRERLRKVELEARRLVSVMHDILDYSAMDTGRIERSETDFTVERVLKSVMDCRAADADARGVEMFMKIHPMRSGALTGDAGLLAKILDRLADNAVKFTDEGYVCLEANELTSEADGPEGGGGQVAVLFTVRDTGIGIPDCEESQVFTAFSQADGSAARRHGGAGLGLSFARKAVELLGGRIWFEPAPGGGTSFHFTARFRSAAAGNGDAGAAAGSAAAAGGKSDMAFRGRTALVCAPSGPGRDSLLEFLNYYFLDVRTAAAPDEAMSLLKNAPAPDYVLADLKIPGALDFIAGLAAGGGDSGPPVILMGPKASARSVDSSYYSCYLDKPCSPETLFDALTKAST